MIYIYGDAMTKLDVYTILRILTKADGGCPVCVSDLFKEFLKKFPKQECVARDVWAEFDGDRSFEDYVKS